MKKILLWDPRFPGALPTRLTLVDAVASACVRAGVAAAADPTEQGALAAGGALDPGSLVEIVLTHGVLLGALRRVTVPLAVATIAVTAGVAAATAAPIAGGELPTLGPTTASFTAGAAVGTVITPITGVPTGATATFTPTNGGDANKVAVTGTGASSALVVGLAALVDQTGNERTFSAGPVISGTLGQMPRFSVPQAQAGLPPFCLTVRGMRRSRCTLLAHSR